MCQPHTVRCHQCNPMARHFCTASPAVCYPSSLQLQILRSSCHNNELPSQIDIVALTDPFLPALQHFLILAAADTADCATGQALACEHLWQDPTGKVCISILTTLICCCFCATLGGMQKHFAFTCLQTARAPADSPQALLWLRASQQRAQASMTWGLQLTYIGSSRACITYRHKPLEGSIVRHFCWVATLLSNQQEPPFAFVEYSLS